MLVELSVTPVTSFCVNAGCMLVAIWCAEAGLVNGERKRVSDSTIFYGCNDAGKRAKFAEGLNQDQIKWIQIWLRYAERHVELKIALAPHPEETRNGTTISNGELPAWRTELREINDMQAHLSRRLELIKT